MLIAQAKKKENIAEYVIYMFQIEDMMRACNNDFEIVKTRIVDKFDVDETQRKDISYWYENILEMMKNEGVEKKGHLQVVLNTIDDINDLHLQLLRSPLHPDYKLLYRDAAPVIGQTLAKSGKTGQSEIESCLEYMYMILLMKLRGAEISNDTIFAISKISKMLALLSYKYNMRDADNIDF